MPASLMDHKTTNTPIAPLNNRPQQQSSTPTLSTIKTTNMKTPLLYHKSRRLSFAAHPGQDRIVGSLLTVFTHFGFFGLADEDADGSEGGR